MFGFLKKIGEFVANPVRGLGRIARGNFREGLGDITGTARHVAPFIPGVGLLASAGIGAADDLLKGNSLEDAALGAGKSVLLSKVGSHLMNAGSGGDAVDAALPAEQLATPSLLESTGPPMDAFGGANQRVGQFLQDASGGGAPSTASRAASAATSAIPDPTKTVDAAAGGWLSGMSPYEKANIGLSVAGGAADAYGAYQSGKMEDRQMKMYEEDRRRRIAAEERRRKAMEAASRHLVSSWRDY